MFDFTVIAQTVFTARAVDSRSFDLRWGYTSGGNDNIWIAIGLWITCILMLLFDVSVYSHCCSGAVLSSRTPYAYCRVCMPHPFAFAFASLTCLCRREFLPSVTRILPSCHSAGMLTPLRSILTPPLFRPLAVAPCAGTSSSPS
jgi:hypothetical protein